MSDVYTFGMIGLGTMGRNVLLNLGDHGHSVAGYDRDPEKCRLLEREGNKMKVKGFDRLSDFINHLKSPRAVMMLVPAGKPVDDVIGELLPLLDKGDLIIDGGNSHFSDTTRRVEELEKHGIHFFGMGISGGEEGARHGPSMMPGGNREAYELVAPMFTSIAAKVNGEPCVTYIGPGASGHFVKMVHNGIEYAIMQLIAETYEILHKGMALPDSEIRDLFAQWNEGRLRSFLIEITRDIFAFREPGVDSLLLYDIRDQARSKGTGKWTSQVAMDLGVPIPTIDVAVSMRDLSRYKPLRVSAAAVFNDRTKLFSPDENFLVNLEQALYFSTIMAYAQGMHLLASASENFGYDLKLEKIALIWRGGCIIRSTFLENIYQAFKGNHTLAHLLLDPAISGLITETLPGMRKVTSTAMASAVAMPGYAASLSYFDAFKSEQMPSNLIQAQRDYFGAHTYERISREGIFHTQWQPK
jgi:6-phosphogluconate dehydrogenase